MTKSSNFFPPSKKFHNPFDPNGGVSCRISSFFLAIKWKTAQHVVTIYLNSYTRRHSKHNLWAIYTFASLNQRVCIVLQLCERKVQIILGPDFLDFSSVLSWVNTLFMTILFKKTKPFLICKLIDPDFDVFFQKKIPNLWTNLRIRPSTHIFTSCGSM